MAEFEIIGEGVGDGADEEGEMDEATRQFLAEEQAQMSSLHGGDDDFQSEDVSNGNDNFGIGGGNELKTDSDEFGTGGDDFQGGNDFGGAFQDGNDQPNGGFGDEGQGFGDSFEDGTFLETSGDFPPPPESDDPYSALNEESMNSESDAVREWRTARDDRIAKMDAESSNKEEEMLAKAKEDLDTFYKNYDEQKTKASATNREAESDFLAARDTPPSDRDWERVCDMVDFNPKTQRSTKDTSRMRGILLQLKQTPLVR
eukprot:CFRG4335T1